MSLPIDRFFEACEAPRPLRLRGTQRRPDGTAAASRLWTLSVPFAVVGSDPRADLHLDDPLVSPRHCLLQVLGRKVLAIDLGSGRGLVGSDGPCQAGWIEPGREVGLGGHFLSLAPDAGDEPAADAAATPCRRRRDVPVLTGPLPRVVLQIRARRLTTNWAMRGAIVLVGGDPSCALRLSGSGIARFHAALLRTNRGLWVVDLLGEMEGGAGIAINGRPARFGELAPGEVLEIGDFALSPRMHSPRPITTGVLADQASPSRGAAPSSAAAGPPASRAGVPVPLVASVVPAAPDAGPDGDAFAADLLRLIELQRNEIAALRRDVDQLRGQVETGLKPTGPRPRGLESNAPRPATRRARTRTLGSATRLNVPAPAPAAAPRPSPGIVPPLPPVPAAPPRREAPVAPPLRPEGMDHPQPNPSDAMAFW